MPSVAEVVRRYGGAYLERFGATMHAAHKKVLRAIAACRTGELGLVLYRCECCGQMQAMGRSCGDRHCPACQRDKAEAWLFEASSEALRALAADLKFVGTDRLGFFGVLHTWGRTLEYHPHVHYVVPGGGLSADGSRWLPSQADFLVPAKALSIVFRAKFRDILRREGLLNLVAPTVWSRDWVVHSQAAGDGQVAIGDLRYLAPYVFRVAIGDHRIVSCDDGNVTFAYRRVGWNRLRKMTLDAMEFLRRFLQHVLPAGFQKGRHYGFLSPNSATSIEAVRWLITLHSGAKFALLAAPGMEPAAKPAPRSPVCGGLMAVLGFVSALAPAVFDTS